MLAAKPGSLTETLCFKIKRKVLINDLRDNAMILHKNFVYLYMPAVCLSLSSMAFADKYQDEMQNRLNEQVLSRPFNVQDEATLNKSLDEATERGKPSKSKTQDGYYRYLFNGYYYPHRYWYNGSYYPHPYSYYRRYGYWY